MQDRLIELIGQIYDAAIDPQVWKQVLESVADLLQADSTALQIEFEHTGFALSMAGKFPLETLVDYEQNHVQTDPRFQATIQLGAGRVATSEVLMPMSQFRKTAVYADFFRKWDLPFVVGGLVFKEKDKVGMFVANRSERRGDFGESERQCLEILFPHLRRALEIQSRFDRQVAEQKAIMESVNLLPTGLILVEASSRVIDLNSAAHRIVEQNDGLSIRKGILTAARSDESRELRRIIAEVATRVLREISCPPGVLRLSRPSFKQELALLVAPLPLTIQGLSGHLPASMVFVSDPEEPMRCCPNILSDLFGLTSAESRLAALLAEGLSLQEAAERLGVSYQTVRNQLRSVFQKTETTSQSSLINALLRSPAVIVGQGFVSGPRRKR